MSRILVVDDEPHVTRLARNALESYGYQVETAENGVQALARIEQHLPDLIITDVMMPEMGGFELIDIIRQRQLRKHMPICVLAAPPGMANDRIIKLSRVGFKKNGVMFLYKPFDPKHMISIIKQLLGEEDTSGRPVILPDISDDGIDGRRTQS